MGELSPDRQTQSCSGLEWKCGRTTWADPDSQTTKSQPHGTAQSYTQIETQIDRQSNGMQTLTGGQTESMAGGGGQPKKPIRPKLPPA